MNKRQRLLKKRAKRFTKDFFRAKPMKQRTFIMTNIKQFCKDQQVAGVFSRGRLKFITGGKRGELSTFIGGQ